MLFFYLIALLIVITSNTLYGRLESHSSIAFLGTVVLMLAYITLSWFHISVEKNTMQSWVAWCLLLLAVYITVSVSSGSMGGRSVALLFVLLGIAPLFIFFLRLNKTLELFFKSFVNLVSLLALVSLVLWVSGPILGIIVSNCAIANTWNGLGTLTMSKGYYNLLYVTQDAVIGDLYLVRNTGVFTEAPMYSYTLCVALLLECFLCRRTRISVVTLLVVTVLSTFSSTGYIFLVGLLLVKLISFTPKSNGARILYGLVVILLVAVGLVLCWWLLTEKLATSSGSTRIDDYIAGFRAWQNNILVGNGFGEGDVVREYMSAFRDQNLGMSNSPMPILARGGLLFMLPYLICLFGLFSSQDKHIRVVGLFILFLWACTIVYGLPLTAIMFGLGFESIMSRSSGEMAVSRC